MYTENVQRRECRGWCIACDSRLDKYNIIRIRDDGVIDNSGGPRAAMGWSIKRNSIGLCIAKIFHPSRIWISPAGRPAGRPTDYEFIINGQMRLREGRYKRRISACDALRRRCVSRGSSRMRRRTYQVLRRPTRNDVKQRNLRGSATNRGFALISGI